MTAPLRAAVIGCGTIAYEHLPYLASSPRVDLVAVCDRSKALAQFAADRFKAEAVFTDAAAMLATIRPDVVHVLTPPHTHADLARLALANGAHVLCEKPMTGTATETRELLAEAEAKGRMLIESRNYLYNDTVLELRRLIDAGRLGEVVECDLLLSLDFLAGPFGDTNLAGPALGLSGGAIHDFLPHLAYLFLVFTGSHEATQVKGTLANVSGNARAGFDHLDALVEADGGRGRLRIATDTAPDMFRVYIRGTKATAEADLYNPYIRIEGAPDIGKRAPLGQWRNGWALARAGIRNFRNKVMQHGTYHGLPRMIDAFYAAIAAGEPAPFGTQEMLETAVLCDRLVALANKS